MYHKTEIEELMSLFQAQQLPKARWTHEAHLIVAHWYNWRYDFNNCLELVRKGIIAHNESVGTPNTDTEGYHETITKFWLLLTKRFIEVNSMEDELESLNSFLVSIDNDSSIPLKYYSKELLFSVEARKSWVEADIQPLNFD